MKSFNYAVLATVVVSVVYGAVAFLPSSFWADAELPVQEKAPGFTLVNQNGTKVALQNSLGKIRVVSFFYVRCANPKMCPLTSRKLTELQDMLGPLNSKVVFLRISFDSRNDDPRTLKKYGNVHKVDFANWHFLTGEPERIDNVCNAYDITRKRRESGQIKHSMLLYLVDQAGRIRKVYAGTAETSWTAEEIKRDIESLLAERSLENWWAVF